MGQVHDPGRLKLSVLRLGLLQELAHADRAAAAGAVQREHPDLRGHLSSLAGFYNNPPDRGSHQPLDRFGGAYPYVWTSSVSSGQSVLGDLATGKVGLNGSPASVIAVRELSPCERYYYDISTLAPPLCK